MKPGRGGTLRRTAFFLLPLGAAVVALVRVSQRFTRYEVAGESMTPALLPGDFVIVDRRAYRNSAPSPGDVVLAPDPREPSRQLVKRVRRCDPLDGAWIEGDNPGASTDSRHFGPVPVESILGRVRWRYWPPRRIGPVL